MAALQASFGGGHLPLVLQRWSNDIAMLVPWTMLVGYTPPIGSTLAGGAVEAITDFLLCGSIWVKT